MDPSARPAVSKWVSLCEGSGWVLFQKVLIIDAACAVVGCLLRVSLYRTGGSQVLSELTHSVIVTCLVATPIVLMLSRYGRRFQELRFPANWIWPVAMILACAAAGTLAHNLIFLALGLLPPSDFWTLYWQVVQFSAVLSLMFGVGAFGYTMMRVDLDQVTVALRTKELQEERALKLALEAQLASLESHIRPHFLFNTLNTISSLIPEDPRLAEDLLGKLAALLRLSLDANHERVTPLENELKIVRDYLEIEHARFGDRLRFRLDVPADLLASEIPSLSLQTLVENSVKHAVAPRLEGAEIRVRGYRRGGRTHLGVSDNGPGFSQEAIRPGHGLDNLRQRLAALFGAEARLEVARANGFTEVSLCLPGATSKAAV